MHEAIDEGSMRSAQTRAGGASNVYDPLMSIRCCAPATRRYVRGDGAQVYRQLCEIGEGARRQKIVHVRERGLKASSQRRIVHRADERVQPDEAMTAPLQSSHLFAQHVRITTIPAIRDEEHDRGLMQHAPRPSLMELPQCRADARATGPVRHHVGYGIDRVVKPPQTHL